MLNAYRRSDIPNLAIVTLGAGDAITLHDDQGSTHLIVDVVGWHVEEGGADFQPVEATRATGSGRIGPAEVRQIPATAREALTPRLRPARPARPAGVAARVGRVSAGVGPLSVCCR